MVCCGCQSSGCVCASFFDGTELGRAAGDNDEKTRDEKSRDTKSRVDAGGAGAGNQPPADQH